MSERHPGRLGKKTAALLAGAAVIGGLLATTGVASASTVVTKPPVDLSITNTPSTIAVSRTGSVHDVLTITNEATSSGSARASLLITVAGVSDSTVVADAGITCESPTVVGTGFTRVCTTDAALAPGSSLSVVMDLAPSTDPLVHATTVVGAVSLVKTIPVVAVDPVMTNNKAKIVAKIGDSADLAATVTGAESVLRSGLESIDAAITNNGPNPVYAKFRLTVAWGAEATFTADAGLTCSAPVVNSMATGYYRVCTTGPLSSGETLHVQSTIHPTTDLRYRFLKVTAAASKASGLVTDSNLANNKFQLPVEIANSIEV